jgi:hypothetical protein
VPIAHRAPAWDRARPWLSAVAVAALMLAALAGPVVAHDRYSQLRDGTGSTHLRDGWVAPRLARPTSVIRFSVTYRNGVDAAPVFVRVLIDGRPRTMAPRTLGGDYRQGVRFAYAGKLAAGRHRVRFEALGVDGTKASLGAGWVRVVARSTGGSSGDGSSSGHGSSGSGGGGSSGAAGGTTSDAGSSGGDSTGPGGGGPSSSGGSTGGPAGPEAGAGEARGSGDSGVAAAPGALADAVSRTTGPDDDIDDGGGMTAGSLGGPLGAGSRTSLAGASQPIVDPSRPTATNNGPAAGSVGPGNPAHGGRAAGLGAPDGSQLLGLGGPLDGMLRAYPVLITTSGTVAVWMAFVFFGKRRRDGEPPAPDPVLAAHAAAGPEPVPAASLVPPAASGLPIPPGVDPDEAALPRWRRPSLMLARKTDPLRTDIVTPALTFAEGAVRPVDGAERRRIRYRLVRLMDVPDEVRANEIGILDQGDEVQVIEAVGTYRLVLCPDGRQGWLHRMVLGDVIEADEPIELAPDGLDEDVLAAFLAARQKSA